MKTYIFHRKDMWYLVELKDDKTALSNVKSNPGTTKVTTVDRKIIWQEEVNPSIIKDEKP